MIKAKFIIDFCVRVQFIYVLVIGFLMTSCGFSNRMTSPQVLEKNERIWTYGIAYEPTATKNYDQAIWGFQPILGYRSGLGKNQELGITLYGVYFPGFVIDHKYKYYEKNNFILTGNTSAFGGIIRPVGLQYDLLFGNRKLYGVTGLKYDFTQLMRDKPSWIIGLGTEFEKDVKFGIQITYANSFPEYNYSDRIRPFREITIGVKFDFIKTKKKYRAN